MRKKISVLNIDNKDFVAMNPKSVLKGFSLRTFFMHNQRNSAGTFRDNQCIALSNISSGLQSDCLPFSILHSVLTI